jgi:hypothetical protein
MPRIGECCCGALHNTADLGEQKHRGPIEQPSGATELSTWNEELNTSGYFCREAKRFLCL